MDLNTWYSGRLNAFSQFNFDTDEVLYKVVPRGGQLKVIIAAKPEPGFWKIVVPEIAALCLEGAEYAYRDDLWQFEMYCKG